MRHVFQDTFGRNTLGPLALRLALGAIIFYHGLVKVTVTDSDWGAGWVTTLRLEQQAPPPGLMDKLERLTAYGEDREGVRQIQEKVRWAYATDVARAEQGLYLHHTLQLLVAWGEVLGGLAVLAGFLTRWAALGLIVIQLGAIWTATGEMGLFYFQGGYLYNVALIAMCLSLFLEGAGNWSVDHWLYMRDLRRDARPAAGAAPPAPAVAADARGQVPVGAAISPPPPA